MKCSLRSYLTTDDPLKPLEMGSEKTPAEFVAALVAVFREVKRCLRPDGVVWLNMGDSYAGNGSCGGGSPLDHRTDGKSNKRNPTHENVRTCHEAIGRKVPPGLKALDLVGIPERLMLGLQEDGWYVRSRVEWCKKSPMPISVMGWRWERHRVRVASGQPSSEPSKIQTNNRAHAARGTNGKDFERGAEWSPCPGCTVCKKNNGLVLRRGAWRPTSCHEPVFLLAKSSTYFMDGEAARVPAATGDPRNASYRANGKSRLRDKGIAVPPGQTRHTGIDARESTGANLRDAIFTDQRHFRLRDNLSEAEAAGLAAHLDALRPYLEPWCDDGMSDVLHLGPSPLKEKHYAAFSPKLVLPLLRASTSAMGCCAQCGSPIVRVVEREEIKYRPNSASNRGNAAYDALTGNRGAMGVDSQTLAWRPSCSCQTTETRHQLILDPFCGSGTVGVVCRQLGLRFIGFDLSSEYVALANKRIARALRERPKDRPATPAAGPSLFDDIQE